MKKVLPTPLSKTFNTFEVKIHIVTALPRAFIRALAHITLPTATKKNRQYQRFFFIPIKILQENILKDKQHGEDVHHGRDLLCLLADQIDQHVGDDTDRDTLGNAVKQRHCDDTQVCGNR